MTGSLPYSPASSWPAKVSAEDAGSVTAGGEVATHTANLTAANRTGTHMNADIYSLFLTGANVESMSVAALKQLITSTGYTLDGAPAWLECPVLQQLICC